MKIKDMCIRFLTINKNHNSTYSKLAATPLDTFRALEVGRFFLRGNFSWDCCDTLPKHYKLQTFQDL